MAICRIMRGFLLSGLVISGGLAGCDGGKSTPPVKPPSPDAVVALNGTYYKQDIADTAVAPALEFAVLDKGGDRIPGAPIQLVLLEGDGTLSADTIITDSTGIAALHYSFDGLLAHAVIRARWFGLDSTEVILRKNMLVPAVSAYFILLDDDYGTIKALLGPPDKLVVSGQFYLFIADYEKSRGFVVILTDKDKDSFANDNEPVSYLIVNDNEDTTASNNYKGSTREGIGIGSLFGEVRAAFGQYSNKVADLSPPPPYWKYTFDTLGMRIFTTYNPDTALEDSLDVREIHIDRPTGLPISLRKEAGFQGAESPQKDPAYRWLRGMFQP